MPHPALIFNDAKVPSVSYCDSWAPGAQLGNGVERGRVDGP